jgi:hypothetical protein
VIEAVRVPPSACRTSQSMRTCISASAARSVTARSERPQQLADLAHLARVVGGQYQPVAGESSRHPLRAVS